MSNDVLFILRENNKSFLREFEERFKPYEGGEVSIHWFDRIKDFGERSYRIAKAEQVAEIDDLKAQLKAAHESRIAFVEYCRMIEVAKDLEKALKND